MNKAVIMAGGFGTRLRPLTMTIPKPMVPILNKPMMHHIVTMLVKHNITDVVSVLYYHPEVIKEYFGNGDNFGIKMDYVLAHADYGTAGAVKNAEEHLGDRIIIISGDVLTDFDLTAALNYHEQKGAKATMLLTRVPSPLEYGVVITDNQGKITRFLEKPSWGEVFSDTINTGIYILEPEVLELIPYQEEFDFSKDLFPLMLKLEMPLYGYICEGYWKDIGNLNEYQKGQTDALMGGVDLGFNVDKENSLLQGNNCKLGNDIELAGKVILGNNVIIEDQAKLINCVIGDNCHIGMGARLSGVTLWENVDIGNFAELNDDVICSNSRIGSSTTIAENVFISNDCEIGNKANLMSNIKLWPFKHIEDGAILSRSLVQEEKWNKELFTDARISGISNLEMHPEFGAKLGAAIGLTFGKGVQILASRDPDKVSRIIKRAITAGISSVGVNINDLQTTSIPQTRQELRTGKYSGGVHVRRSPRNPEFTDIIIFNKEGRDITIARTKTIERYFFGEDIKRVKPEEIGNLYYPERTNEIYQHRFLESIDKSILNKHKFKLLVDYNYGLAASIFPYLLGRLSVNSLSLHNYVDASRYRYDADMQIDPAEEVSHIMKSLSYELGFIIEPGAEKISLIDNNGKQYSGQRLLSIVTKLFLESNKNREPYKIAVTMTASKEIEIIAADYNVEVIKVKNTHSAMMEATREQNVLFVGGIYGGFIFPEFLFAADGMYSIAKILEMLAGLDRKVSDLNNELPVRYQFSSSVVCPWEYKGLVMRKAMKYSEDKERELVEGIKILTDDEWVLMLPDKEQPAFNVLADASTPEKAEALSKEFAGMISGWIAEA
jgi:mannose-1-phosphate guanylyltransferase/phosphomannomutase